MATDILPVELWILIAEDNPTIWWQLVHAISCVGRYSLNETIQSRMVDRFVNSFGYLPNGDKHGCHTRKIGKKWIASEKWYHRGKRHRDGHLPALIKYDTKYEFRNNAPNVQRWYQHGLLHRDNDLPACVILWDFSGNRVSTEVWYQYGRLHRNGDKPAKIQYSEEPGEIWESRWYQTGELHRDDDRPAYIHNWDDGTLRCEKWYQNGELQRNGDFPAWKEYHADGSLLKEKWYQNGQKTAVIHNYY